MDSTDVTDINCLHNCKVGASASHSAKYSERKNKVHKILKVT